MKINKDAPGTDKLRLASSGTKIWNQFMMYVVVGILPALFPNLIKIENKNIVLFFVASALVTSYIYEIIRWYMEKKNKDITPLINLQLITSVILLTGFLHFFGRINGPFFILYILTIMESFLNVRNSLSEILVVMMVSFTTVEFVWLNLIGEIKFGYLPIVEYSVRQISLVFIRSYGAVLAQKIISEAEARNKYENSNKALREVTRHLEKANLRLKDLSSLKDEFVSIASHELRTPMTAIKSYLWLALNKGYQLDEKLKKDLQRAYDSTERTISLVKDMLTISRIEGRRLELIPEKTELYQLISQVADELSIKAKEKNQQFSITKPNIQIWVNADKDRLIEVLQNLIGNAFKFTPNNGRIIISLRVVSSMAQVLIADNGPGIPKDKISLLFQKFGRIEHSYTKVAETPGTGLGLYIAKQIISLHKGKIWVESEVGKGSTFIFSIPLYKGGTDD